MNNYTIVTFATKDGKYDEYGQKFEKNMQDLGINYDIEYIDPIIPAIPSEFLQPFKRQKKDTGRTRAEFLIKKLKQYNNTIIWMDCDDGFKQKPSFPGNLSDFDVGFVKSENGVSIPIMARILLLNPTKNAFHFLKVWDYLNKWDELEAVGGSHIRLNHTRNIHFNKANKNITKTKEIDLTPYLFDIIEISKHRG